MSSDQTECSYKDLPQTCFTTYKDNLLCTGGWMIGFCQTTATVTQTNTAADCRLVPGHSLLRIAAVKLFSICNM